MNRCISASLLAEWLKATEQVHQQVMQSLLPNQHLGKCSFPVWLALFGLLHKGKQMHIGYVRVSTNDQNTALQRNALESAECELIFEDKISGKTSDRPGLKKVLRTLSEGDTLVVWKLDRLGRSMRHLVALVEELRERGINFRSLTDSIDTSTPMGRFFFHVMGALAEMERELIIERTRAGLAAARAQGRIGGRRPKLTPEQWAQAGRLIAAGETRQRVAIIYDVGISTLYKKFPATKSKDSGMHRQL